MGRTSAPRRRVAVLSTATRRWSRRGREVLLGKQDLPKSATALSRELNRLGDRASHKFTCSLLQRETFRLLLKFRFSFGWGACQMSDILLVGLSEAFRCSRSRETSG